MIHSCIKLLKPVVEIIICPHQLTEHNNINILTILICLKWDYVTFERRNNALFLLQFKSLIYKQ